MLSEEYRRKLEYYIKNIPQRLYKPIEEVQFSGFFTYDRLTAEEAAARETTPLADGTKWGKKWEYGWFFAEINIPQELKGRRIAFTANLGEGIVFVNGDVYGALDKEHSYITLTRCADGGEKYEIAMEIYAGHDGLKYSLDQVHSRFVMSESDLEEFPENITQRVVRNGSFGAFFDDTFALLMDIKTLYGLSENLDVNSLRKAKIDKALCKMCDEVDIELPDAEFAEAVKSGSAILSPMLKCTNSSSAPAVFAIGHSHLDLEWLWTKNETRRKIARTVGNQLKLLDEYNDYKYIQTQPWLIETLKNEYPKLYTKFKKAVKDGKFIVEGGMWVEADVNLPSGESLIRQFIFGKKFIRDEFGYDSKILWLPDIFGVSAALPQIMNGCGIKYFMNAKIKWQYNGGEEFPYSSFMWQGIDGTEILTNLTQEYATEMTPSKIFEKWGLNKEKADVPICLFPYGHGDGGGGATREHLEYLKREKNLEGMPKVISENPVNFYETLENECEINKKYVGELYYSAHRGSYTSQARTKKLNRKSEFALRDAEMWQTLLEKDLKAETDELWKRVLFNQFHDIIPGTAITAVYERVEEDLKQVVSAAESILKEAEKSIVRKNDEYITVFNSLSWDREAFIQLPDGYTSAYDTDGKKMMSQEIGGKAFVMVNVPSCGFKSYRMGDEPIQKTQKQENYVLENDLIRAIFNEQGNLISVKDKESGIEYLEKESNIFRMYNDAPTFFDAWDIDSFYENMETGICENAGINLLYNGELESALQIRKKIGNSEIVQRVSLQKDSRHIDFETEIDWQETHKLLKIDFNTNLQTDELVSEIQYGYIKRPNHKSRKYDADRFEVCQHKWSALAEGRRAAAILNDSKYGISADGGRMSLTALKSSASPARKADRGVQKFTYSFMPVEGAFVDSEVIRKAYELNCPVSVCRGYSEEKSMLSLSCDNVIVDTVKQAEDGSGNVVIRLYESKKTHTRCTIKLNFEIEKAYLTDMLEENSQEIVTCGSVIELDFGAFEVKTLKIIKKYKEDTK